MAERPSSITAQRRFLGIPIGRAEPLYIGAHVVLDSRTEKRRLPFDPVVVIYQTSFSVLDESHIEYSVIAKGTDSQPRVIGSPAEINGMKLRSGRVFQYEYCCSSEVAK